MTSGRFRFDRFALDPLDRQLTRDGVPVELNARYLDALTLLVREPGKLVSKDRFLAEVWRGVPVTDEALTQCIRTLRRQLGDSAANPRFIETVPKHGYRFISTVERLDPEAGPAPGPGTGAQLHAEPDFSARPFLILGSAGTLGAGLAGIIGGLFYGFAAASQPLQAGMGAISVLLVLTSLTILIALLGGAGVSFGIAAGVAARRPWASIPGGALGGMMVGAIVKLLGLDAFSLLFGQAPAGITGAAEGALLGGAIGLGFWLAHRGAVPTSVRRAVVIAGGCGAGAGILIALAGGRLMGGSLDALARSFPQSRLRLDPIGALFGESGFGPLSQMVTAGLEGALFGACVVGAMILTRRAVSRRAR